MVEPKFGVGARIIGKPGKKTRDSLKLRLAMRSSFLRQQAREVPLLVCKLERLKLSSQEILEGFRVSGICKNFVMLLKN